MAGQYLKMQRAVFQDEDFLALSERPRWVYFALCAQQTISAAGAFDLMERRIAKHVGCTVAELTEALDELQDHDYIRIDDDTGEVAVRTYARHDINENNSNMLTASASAFDRILSPELRAWLWPNLPEKVRAVVPRPDGVPSPSEPPPSTVHTQSEQSSNSLRSAFEAPPPPTTTTPTAFGLPPTNPADSSVDNLSPQPRRSTVIDILAHRELDDAITAGTHIKSRPRYLTGIRKRLTTDHATRIDQLLTDYPTAPDTLIASATTGDPSALQNLRYHRPRQETPA